MPRLPIRSPPLPGKIVPALASIDYRLALPPKDTTIEKLVLVGMWAV